jgi:hypothetical protein
LEDITHEGSLDGASAKRFLVTFACWFTLTPLLLGVFQLLGGYDRPEYPSAFALNEPYAFGGWVVMVSSYLFAMGWVWVGKTALIISLLGRKIDGFPRATLAIKLIVMLLGILSILMLTFFMPKGP